MHILLVWICFWSFLNIVSVVNRININFAHCVRALAGLQSAAAAATSPLICQSSHFGRARLEAVYMSPYGAHYTSIHCVSRVQRSISVSMSNFVAVGQTVAELWRFIDFFKCQMSTIVSYTRFEPS